MFIHSVSVTTVSWLGLGYFGYILRNRTNKFIRIYTRQVQTIITEGAGVGLVKISTGAGESGSKKSSPTHL